jgi:hypothetical protein
MSGSSPARQQPGLKQRLACSAVAGNNAGHYPFFAPGQAETAVSLKNTALAVRPHGIAYRQEDIFCSFVASF